MHRAARIPRKENRPIISRHLATTSKKKEGSPNNPSFPHSLAFLLLLSLFFFIFSIFLLLLQSLVLHLAGELHGHRRDVYMMISFFSWCFRIPSSFSSFFFFFLLSFSDEASTPPPWATTAVVVPVAASRRDACTSGIGEVRHPSWWLLLLRHCYGGLGHLGLFQP